MRKIDKAQDLALKYFTWLKTLTEKAKNHPRYNSSHGKFYYDIVANLIYAQAGICAYTERKLQDSGNFGTQHWKDGKFLFDNFEFAGQLDHYDANLKDKSGWDWDNFFLIDSDINMKLKRNKKPRGLLKPDLAEFNPETLLEYDLSTHCFLPNRALVFALQESICVDISILGLNFQPIVDLRRAYLSPIMESVKFGNVPFQRALSNIYQFYTAFNLSKHYMEN